MSDSYNVEANRIPQMY